MYGAFARHLDPEAAEVGGAYWALGDLELLGSLFEAAGLEAAGARRRLVDAGVQAMARFVVDGGRVELPIGGHLVTAVAPG